MITTYIFIIMSFALLMLLDRCQLISNSIEVEVPKGYNGWCFIIPVAEKLKVSLEKDGKYQVDEHGIVYVPKFEVDSVDFKVKVFKSNIDISDDMQVAGTVNLVKSKEGVKSRYKFIRFYLPPFNQRSTPNGNKYWHDKGYEYREQASKIFDSLLLNGRLRF